MISWKEISKRIDGEINPGTKIPDTRGNNREVTKKVGSRIYMRTGVKTNNEKHITKEMVQYAYDIIKNGGVFTRGKLEKTFPKEYKQGGCVFSMTGGILVKLGVAKYNSKNHCYEKVMSDC